MNPALAGVALAVVIGAVVAGSARNARTAILGLVAVLLFGPFLADPTAQPLGLAARLVGATLSGYLLWVAARGGGVWTGGSLLGWPVELLVAASAAAVGYGSHGLGAPPLGPALAQAAGFALAALSIAPIANGRDVVRVGTGLLLLVSGAILVRTGAGRHARGARGGRHRRPGSGPRRRHRGARHVGPSRGRGLRARGRGSGSRAPGARRAPHRTPSDRRTMSLAAYLAVTLGFAALALVTEIAPPTVDGARTGGARGRDGRCLRPQPG